MLENEGVAFQLTQDSVVEDLKWHLALTDVERPPMVDGSMRPLHRAISRQASRQNSRQGLTSREGGRLGGPPRNIESRDGPRRSDSLPQQERPSTGDASPTFLLREAETPESRLGTSVPRPSSTQSDREGSSDLIGALRGMQHLATPRVDEQATRSNARKRRQQRATTVSEGEHVTPPTLDEEEEEEFPMPTGKNVISASESDEEEPSQMAAGRELSSFQKLEMDRSGNHEPALSSSQRNNMGLPPKVPTQQSNAISGTKSSFFDEDTPFARRSKRHSSNAGVESVDVEHQHGKQEGPRRFSSKSSTDATVERTNAAAGALPPRPRPSSGERRVLLWPPEYRDEAILERMHEREQQWKTTNQPITRTFGTQTGATPPPTPVLSSRTQQAVPPNNEATLEESLDEAAHRFNIGLHPALDILYRSSQMLHFFGDSLALVCFADIERGNSNLLKPKLPRKGKMIGARLCNHLN